MTQRLVSVVTEVSLEQAGGDRSQCRSSTVTAVDAVTSQSDGSKDDEDDDDAGKVRVSVQVY